MKNLFITLSVVFLSALITVCSNNSQNEPHQNKSKATSQNLVVRRNSVANIRIDSLLANTQTLARNNKNVLFDGYLKVSSLNIVYGKLSGNGSVIPSYPSIPIIDDIPKDRIRSFLAQSDLARVVKIWAIQDPKTNVDKIKVRLFLLNKDSDSYGFNPVDFEMYRNGDEGGLYVFQTMTKEQGKPVLFTSDESLMGNYHDAIVLCVKNSSDIFYYQMLE